MPPPTNTGPNSSSLDPGLRPAGLPADPKRGNLAVWLSVRDGPPRRADPLPPIHHGVDSAFRPVVLCDPPRGQRGPRAGRAGPNGGINLGRIKTARPSRRTRRTRSRQAGRPSLAGFIFYRGTSPRRLGRGRGHSVWAATPARIESRHGKAFSRLASTFCLPRSKREKKNGTLRRRRQKRTLNWTLDYCSTSRTGS